MIGESWYGRDTRQLQIFRPQPLRFDDATSRIEAQPAEPQFIGGLAPFPSFAAALFATVAGCHGQNLALPGRCSHACTMSDDRDVVIRSRLSSALIIRVPEHGANVLSGIGTNHATRSGGWGECPAVDTCALHEAMVG